MRELELYRDPATGYEIRRYTRGPERNAKLYFTTENFTRDDRFFFFNKRVEDGSVLCMADVETGEYDVVAGCEYRGFAMDRFENYGVLMKDNIVCRLDCDTLRITEIGELPAGSSVTGHLTTSRSGRVACSIKQRSCIYALAILDPGKGECQIVHQSDYHLGHTQICPTDENLIFYIHETGGDALQRTWLFDVQNRAARPYYAESPNEWITHEVWAADGEHMAIMKLPRTVLIGDKAGHSFRVAAVGDQFLHPCVSRDNDWLCADRTSYWDNKVQDAIFLANAHSGAIHMLAHTGAPASGADHAHPSFNRRGDMILFSCPDEAGTAQVCAIDLNQVTRP